MEYILERYGQRPDLLGRLNQLWKKTLHLEDQIFKPLPFGPEAVASRIVPADYESEMKEYSKLMDHREDVP